MKQASVKSSKQQVLKSNRTNHSYSAKHFLDVVSMNWSRMQVKVVQALQDLSQPQQLSKKKRKKKRKKKLLKTYN